MRRFFIALVVTSLLAGPLPGPALTADFSLGVQAYQAGDYQTALAEFSALAGQGLASAQFNLGVMYANGEGVPQDQAEAVRWYRMAAEQGDADAQHNLGVMYANGEGVPQDDAEAARWFRMAAEQGVADAQFALALKYASGEGVPASNVIAHMWYNIASANGRVRAREVRDGIETQMTPQDISEAQQRAGLCMSSGYQNCD